MGAAWLTAGLIRRQRDAESAEAEVRHASDELARLYGQERTIAETLQRALLPIALPEIRGLEAAARYLPGTHGVDIGGDWYSLLPLEDDRFAFVMGDVSGRGVEAASIMARLRFTIRAHALDGDSPAEILDKCTRHLDIVSDGHFATVLVAIGDVKRGHVTIASAGHLPPLLLSAGHATFIETFADPPIGMTTGPYRSVTVSIAAPATMLGFTDGLVERRDENIDVGLERLEEAALAHDGKPLDDVVELIVDDLDAHDSEDDIAMLCVRWVA